MNHSGSEINLYLVTRSSKNEISAKKINSDKSRHLTFTFLHSQDTEIKIESIISIWQMKKGARNNDWHDSSIVYFLRYWNHVLNQMV